MTEQVGTDVVSDKVLEQSVIRRFVSRGGEGYVSLGVWHDGDAQDPDAGSLSLKVFYRDSVDFHHLIKSSQDIEAPLVVCTSSTRPSSPHTGLLIWETNTLRLYTWTGSKWLFLVGGGEEGIPGVSLRQSKRQRINDDNTWTVVEWDEEVNDAYNFFNKSVSSTDVVVKVAGSYRIEVGLQWDPEFVPDQAEVILSVNGVDTEIRNNQFMRGNLFSPGFSQTLFLSGTLNFQTNDVLRVRVRVKVGSSLIGKIFSFFDPDSKINSRLDMNFIGG